MLALTKKTEYGLMALTFLSRNGQHLYSAREISDACQIPLPLLMNILKSLAQHDIITSTRGARGGYRLAVTADKITLADIVTVLEGKVRLVQCVDDGDCESPYENRCELTGCCSIRSPLLKIHREFEEFLSGITIARLVNDNTTVVTIQKPIAWQRREA